MTPGSSPLSVFVFDVTVYEPGPVPTVTCASAAAVRVRKPPTLSLNADGVDVLAVVRAGGVRRELQAIRVEPDLHRGRGDARARGVDVADDGREAAVAGAHVVAGERSGSQPARRATAVIVPAAALSVMLWPASRLENVWFAPPSTLSTPSVPACAAPSVDSDNAPSASPPVTLQRGLRSFARRRQRQRARADERRGDRRAGRRRGVLHGLRELARGVGAVRERERRRRAVDLELERVVGAVDDGRPGQRRAAGLRRRARRLRHGDRVRSEREGVVRLERRDAERACRRPRRTPTRARRPMSSCP